MPWKYIANIFFWIYSIIMGELYNLNDMDISVSFCPREEKKKWVLYFVSRMFFHKVHMKRLN